MPLTPDEAKAEVAARAAALVQAVAASGADRARGYVRVDTGELRESIGVRQVDARTVALEATAAHALIIELLDPFLLRGAEEAIADLPAIAARVAT